MDVAGAEDGAELIWCECSDLVLLAVAGDDDSGIVCSLSCADSAGVFDDVDYVYVRCVVESS